MSQEVKRARAQYLNGLAVALLGSTVSAVPAGAPLWALVPAAALSLLLHWLAVETVRQGK
ncbi:hypothetical protein [Devosia sp. 1635]|uniref:hypothetical protein n=1 Tax=Devosia sp. 1635 TaxID=2726066 RepID=UPI001565D7A1|nr:hypothetical protein [Devosia sp. 1635]